MATALKLLDHTKPVTLEPTQINCGDILRIDGAKGDFFKDHKYFLVAQTSFSFISIFPIGTSVPRDHFNRVFEPVAIVWNELNTKTIKDLYPEFKDADIKVVKATITIEIEE